MARSGHSVENPVTGHTVKFLKTAAETGGDLLRIEYIVPNREEPLQYIPLHFHHVIEERFEVASGYLGVQIDKKQDRRSLGPGEDIVIPPDTVHAFWNAGEAELCFITEIRPAAGLQTYWETAFGLAANGQVNIKGVVGFWQLMALIPVMDTYMPGLPAGFQQTIFRPFVWLSHQMGYKAAYPEYHGLPAG